MSTSIKIATRSDWDYILKLRNTKSIRQFMYNNKPITKKEHYAYLENKYADSNFVNWIIYYNSEKVGYVRISNGDISIMLEPKMQGKGISTKALQLIEKEAKKRGIKKLIGKVLVDNESSKRIFIKNDYKLKMFWFEKNIK